MLKVIVFVLLILLATEIVRIITKRYKAYKQRKQRKERMEAIKAFLTEKKIKANLIQELKPKNGLNRYEVYANLKKYHLKISNKSKKVVQFMEDDTK